MITIAVILKQHQRLRITVDTVESHCLFEKSVLNYAHYIVINQNKMYWPHWELNHHQ